MSKVEQNNDDRLGDEAIDSMVAKASGDTRHTEQMYTGLELKTMKFPPMTIYNKDFLPLANGVLTMISGAGGIGKGFIVLQSAIRFLQEKKDARAALWFAEDGLREIKSRLDMFDIADEVLNRMHFVNYSPSEYKSVNDWNEIFELADFVVIDPLAYFYTGDENSNNDASTFMQMMNDKCVAQDNIVIVVHHHSKDGSTRGASSFKDNSRLVYELIPCEDKEAPNGAVSIRLPIKDNFNVCQEEIHYLIPQKMEKAKTFKTLDFGDDL